MKMPGTTAFLRISRERWSIILAGGNFALLAPLPGVNNKPVTIDDLN